jgi:hypothetical protein
MSRKISLLKPHAPLPLHPVPISYGGVQLIYQIALQNSSPNIMFVNI